MVIVLPGCYTLELEKIGKETHLKVGVAPGLELIPSVICSRRKEFHGNLLKICGEAHHKFLTEVLVPPIVIPEGKQVTRWHPRFQIDQVPDIIPLEGILPVKPEPDKLGSAREVIARAQNIFENANPRMKQAMKDMLERSPKDSPKMSANKPSSSSSPSTLKGLKGVSQSLLEKVFLTYLRFYLIILF